MKAARAAARATARTNAEKYAAEYAADDLNIIKQKRDAKAAGSVFCESEAKLAFVIRTRG